VYYITGETKIFPDFKVHRHCPLVPVEDRDKGKELRRRL
jgi:hypothetical protein